MYSYQQLVAAQFAGVDCLVQRTQAGYWAVCENGFGHPACVDDYGNIVITGPRLGRPAVLRIKAEAL